jgi:hypothetical protein
MVSRQRWVFFFLNYNAPHLPPFTYLSYKTIIPCSVERSFFWLCTVKCLSASFKNLAPLVVTSPGSPYASEYSE